MTSQVEAWNDLNIDYEQAYGTNPFKKAVVQEAIKLLPPGSRALDIGCGTGVPVAQMLADADINVFGTDLSPKMIAHAKERVKGNFQVADMLTFKPFGAFDAVFIIFSQLSLSFEEFSDVAFRFAKALRPGGLMVVGQAHTDPVVPIDDPAWDGMKSYVEAYPLPFMGKDWPTLMFSCKGQRRFLESMGMEVIYESVNLFHPGNPKCEAEHQQYVIARRLEEREVEKPRVGD